MMIGPLLILSTPLFVGIFFYTWWIRGKGFDDLIRPFRRRTQSTNVGPRPADPSSAPPDAPATPGRPGPTAG